MPNTRVHRNTISAFESDQTAPNSSTLAVLRAALEGDGVEFIAENGGGAGVRLKKVPTDEGLREQLNASNDV